MNRAQLEHAIRAACNVSDDTELFVFGSQAILGQYPEAHDLAASKLMAFREKYTEFVRHLLIDNMIDLNTLLNRLMVTQAEYSVKERALLWTQRMAENL